MSSNFTFKSSGMPTRPTRMKPPHFPQDSPPQPRSRSSSISSTTSFTSAVSNQNDSHKRNSAPNNVPQPRFSPIEEAEMLQTSNLLKLAANNQFAKRDYSSAISSYDKALAELPIYLDYELAVLQSNISACYLQLGEWKEAIESAERGLEHLERELPMPKPKSDSKSKSESRSKSKSSNGKSSPKMNGKSKATDLDEDEMTDEEDDQIVELPDDTTDEQANELLASLTISDQKKADVTRIRSKLLLRRARSKVMLCDDSSSNKQSTPLNADVEPDPSLPSTSEDNPNNKEKDLSTTTSHWSNLSAALNDYAILSSPPYFPILPGPDKKTVTNMLLTLPPRIEVAKKKEVDEMMGKLKVLGNGILKPFGLSTDMFKMTQDPNTGGWSVGFDGKPGKG